MTTEQLTEKITLARKSHSKPFWRCCGGAKLTGHSRKCVLRGVDLDVMIERARAEIEAVHFDRLQSYRLVYVQCLHDIVQSGGCAEVRVQAVKDLAHSIGECHKVMAECPSLKPIAEKLIGDMRVVLRHSV